MSAEVALEIFRSQAILMKTLLQESDVDGVVLTKQRISIEFSLFLRKLARIGNLGFLEGQAESQPTK
jgi:hypothetical protein